MTITAKFESTCPNCLQIIREGARVNWERGQRATHVECPKGAALAVKVLAQAPDAQRANVTALCDAVNGQATSDEARAILGEALDVIEGQLWAEYERQAPKPASTPAQPTDGKGATRLAALAKLQKGIYRVSLTGIEKRYGIDHVNLQLTPSPKYGTVKVAEYQRDGIGRIDKDGQFRYWPSFEDRTGVRTLAVLAAVDIVLGAADPIEFARAYAIEAASCWRCGADLVDEKSRERLLGPDCYRMVAKGA